MRVHPPRGFAATMSTANRFAYSKKRKSPSAVRSRLSLKSFRVGGRSRGTVRSVSRGRLGRAAGALDDLDPGLDTALERFEGLFRRRRHDLAELGHLADVGIERRLREVRLQ